VAAPLSIAPIIEDDWTGEDTTVAEIERELARLRYATSQEGAQPNLRTSVMTHIAWVPPRWKGAAEGTLAGMAERHPSRTLLLVPQPEAADGLDAQVAIRCFPIGDRAICGEVIELTLRGNRATAPASIVLPLLISDLPVFCRWRGEPPFGAPEFEQLVDIVDRLIVDTAEWEELRYADIVGLFGRTAVSDLAWARTAAWRREVAGCWPEIAEQEIEIVGPRAEAHLVRGWLSARLGRKIPPVGEAPELGVWLDKHELPPPAEPNPNPSDLLSAELDRFGPDRVYEEAVRTAAG
jgi:hypothetical protein